MRLISRDGVSCLQFPSLAGHPGFFHGIFLRRAGDGRGGGVDFDVGLGQFTDDAQVWRNRKRMLAFFRDAGDGVYARQVHGRQVGILNSDRPGDTPEPMRPIRLNGDALITDRKGVALVIQVADCQPVIIVDPVNGVAANVHSGWRGSIQNVIAATVRRMSAEFKSRPENLMCGIGPSLGPCCAEFVNFKDELPESFWKYRRSAYLFDFWQASVDQLTDTGVKPENISLAGICTRCNPHLFFSYRAQRPTGRFAALVGIRPDTGSGV